MFFAAPRSLGAAAISLERQAELMPEQAAFVENAPTLRPAPTRAQSISAALLAK